MTNDAKTVNRRPCACGCGTPTSRTWVQGHDQRALRVALAKLGCSNVAQFVRAVAAGEIASVRDQTS